jgi:hypothetical protein
MTWDDDTNGYDGPSRLDEYRAERRATRRCLRPCDEYGTPRDEDEGSETTEDSADEGEE